MWKLLLQSLRWCCVDCVIPHERDVREEQPHTYMWREQAIIEWSRRSDLGERPLIMLVNLVNSWFCLLTVTTRVISSGDLYCCLLPRCEALLTCRSGFPIATLLYNVLKISEGANAPLVARLASALQLYKSSLCNSKLCVTLGNMQKVHQSNLSAFDTSYAFQPQCFAMIALLQTLQKVFLESAG